MLTKDFRGHCLSLLSRSEISQRTPGGKAGAGGVVWSELRIKKSLGSVWTR